MSPYKYYLLPPSEWKQAWWTWAPLGESYIASLPYSIAIHATERDLKCTWIRYQQAIESNRMVATSPTLPAIERYSGTMYKAIAYDIMTESQHTLFNNHVLILSWLFGRLTPQDLIPNYKLPITTKWLKQRRSDRLTDHLNTLPDWTHLVDLLSWVYTKCIKRDSITHTFERPEFLIDWKRATHTVKWIKGTWLREQLQA